MEICGAVYIKSLKTKSNTIIMEIDLTKSYPGLKDKLETDTIHVNEFKIKFRGTTTKFTNIKKTYDRDHLFNQTMLINGTYSNETLDIKYATIDEKTNKRVDAKVDEYFEDILSLRKSQMLTSGRFSTGAHKSVNKILEIINN